MIESGTHAYPFRHPGYRRHWFNDIAGRIAWAESAGWVQVVDVDGRNVIRSSLGFDSVLMEKPEAVGFGDDPSRLRASPNQDKFSALRTVPCR